MTGKIINISQDKFKDIPFYHIKIEGNPKDYSCWQKEGGLLQIGDTIEFTEELKNNHWRLKLVKSLGQDEKSLPELKGGIKTSESEDSRLKSMAVSYAKDLTVAEIGTGKFAKDPTLHTLTGAELIYKWLKTNH
jgi:hypothetical protein